MKWFPLSCFNCLLLSYRNGAPVNGSTWCLLGHAWVSVDMSYVVLSISLISTNNKFICPTFSSHINYNQHLNGVHIFPHHLCVCLGVISHWTYSSSYVSHISTRWKYPIQQKFLGAKSREAIPDPHPNAAYLLLRAMCHGRVKYSPILISVVNIPCSRNVRNKPKSNWKRK